MDHYFDGYEEGMQLVQDCSEVSSYGIIGDQPPVVNYMQTTPWYVYPTKSAREQVQDEILTKMATAIEANDLKQAKKLVELAKALKEL